MTSRFGVWAAIFLGLLSATAVSEEHRVAPLSEAAPDDVSAEIRGLLAGDGVQVFRGSKSMCKIWFVRELPVTPDFETNETVKYPLAVGQLVGVLRFDTKGEDFRGQEIKRGVYTLRYAWQPVDGNHVGTSPTRDFLLLSPIASDTSPDGIDEEQLFELSKEAANSSHPAMLSLLPVEGEPGGEPAMVHEEARDLWSLQTSLTAAGGKTLPILLVVDGHVEG